MNLERNPSIAVNGTATDPKSPGKGPNLSSGSEPAPMQSNTGVSNFQRGPNFKKIDSNISTNYKSKPDLRKPGSKESLEGSRSPWRRKSPNGRSDSREITQRLPSNTTKKTFNSKHKLPSVTAQNFQNQTPGQGNILVEEIGETNNIFGTKTRACNMNSKSRHTNGKLQKRSAQAENNGNASLWPGTESGDSVGNISEIQKSIIKPAQASSGNSMNDGPQLIHSVSGKFKKKPGLPSQKSIQGLNIMGRKRSSNQDNRMPGFKSGHARGLQSSSIDGRLTPLTDRASPVPIGGLSMRGKLSNQGTILTDRESTTGVGKFMQHEPRVIQKNNSMQFLKNSFMSHKNVTSPNFLNKNQNI